MSEEEYPSCLYNYLEEKIRNGVNNPILSETKKTSIMEEEILKETYVKPVSEIVNIEVEQPILSGSAPDFGDGGRWGF